MKKKLMAIILAASMLLTGQVPVFAAFEPEVPETAAEVTDEADTEETAAVSEEADGQPAPVAPDPRTDGSSGTSVNVGDELYMIIDGRVYRASDKGILAENVTYLAENEGILYYAEADGNNTDIHRFNPISGEDTVYVRLFVPVECFAVDGADVYYLFHGEVSKINVLNGVETTVMVDSKARSFTLTGDGVAVEYGETGENAEADLSAGLAGNGTLTSPSLKHEYRWSDGQCVFDYDGYNHAEGVGLFSNFDRCPAMYPYYVEPVYEKYVVNKSGKITCYEYPFKDRDEDAKVSLTEGDSNSHIITGVVHINDVFRVYINDLSSQSRSATWYQLDGYHFITESTFNKYFSPVVNIQEVKNHSTFDDDSSGSYTCYDGAEEICVYSEPSFLSMLWSWLSAPFRWVGSLFEASDTTDASLMASKPVTVKILGTVTNPEGTWYMLDGGGYVEKSEFEAHFKKDTPPADVPVETVTKSTITISPVKYPKGTVVKGSFSLSGTISSTCDLYKITGTVVNTSTGKAELSASAFVGTQNYSLAGSAIDKNLKFGQLKEGCSYYLKFEVSDISNNTKVWQSAAFTVSAPFVTSAAKPTVSTNAVYGGVVVSATVGSAQTLHLSVDGTDCSGGDLLLTAPGSHSIRAYATQNGYDKSAETVSTVSVLQSDEPYVSDINYAAGTLSLSGSGRIYYTTDGTTPSVSISGTTVSVSGTLYTKPIRISAGETTVKAVCLESGRCVSNVSETDVHVLAPNTPTLTYTGSDSRIAKGKIVSFTWTDEAYTSFYRMTVKCGATENVYESEDNFDSFTAEQAGTYTVTVTAVNAFGESAPSNSISFEAMDTVKIYYRDRILTDDVLTPEKLAAVKQRLNAHEGNGAGDKLEGQLISVQEIEYGAFPTRPAVPSKKGFTFAGWSSALYYPAYTDTTIYADFEINYYPVVFYDAKADEDFVRGDILNPDPDKQNVMYTDAAVPPAAPAKQGYSFTGWIVDTFKSECLDYSYVDGKTYVDAAYQWSDKLYPANLSITKFERSNKSYTVDVSIAVDTMRKSELRGRLIVALYSEGKCVATQTADCELSANTTISKSVTVSYSEYRVTAARAYLVSIIGDGKTGEMLAKKAAALNHTFAPDSIYVKKSGYWGPWSSSWQTTKPAASDVIDVTSSTQYSYSDRETKTTNNTSSLSGWTYWYKESQTGGEYYYGTSFTPRDDAYVKRTLSRTEYVPEVKKLYYRYWRWTDGTNDNFCPENGAYQYKNNVSQWHEQWTGWYDHKADTRIGDKGYFCSHKNTSHRHININEYYSDGDPKWWARSVEGQSGRWFYEQTEYKTVQSAYTKYYARDTYYTYYFYRWTPYSAWSDTPYYPSSTRDVKTRTVYKYREYITTTSVTGDANEPLAPTAYTKTISGDLSAYSNIPSGCTNALAMVYKKKNTDPTEGQLEYIADVALSGSNHAYSFTINTRENIGTDTDDYVVVLSLPGEQHLITAAVIEAPKPQYTVNFKNESGTVIDSFTVKEGGSVDINALDMSKYAKEGSRFVKWDKSVINVHENLDVSAKYEPELYQAVFVDHKHETVDVFDVYYNPTGSTNILYPIVKDVEGYQFVGWSRRDTSASRSYVYVADYEKIEYTVTFCDFDGNVISAKPVGYGSAAVPPQTIPNDSRRFMWPIDGETWWNVTHDMTINPIDLDAPQVASPTVQFLEEDAGGTFSVDFDRQDGVEIYYSIDTELTDEDASSFIAMITDADNQKTDEASLLEDSDPEGICCYTDSIMIEDGTVIYAFAVDENGSISPISVFSFCGEDDADEGIIRNDFHIDPSLPQITLPQMSVLPGQTVTLPIRIVNNPGVAKLSLLLAFNTNGLSFVSVKNGDVFPDTAFEVSEKATGECRLMWTNEQEKTRDGVLCYVTLCAAERLGSYDLDISLESCEDGSMHRVPMSYHYGTATVTEEAAALPGDINGDGDVDYNDAILILKHDVGTAALDETRLSAADINGDGEVDFADAIRILMIDAGLIAG